MFTGLIEEIGTVRSIRTGHGRAELRLVAPYCALGTRIGDSIAVNGCCLTVTSIQEEELSFDLLEETISRTNLGTLKRGSAVNLERPLAAGSRLGGHFVQGHIDRTAPIISFDKRDADRRLEVGLAGEEARYIAEKGSIAVNGISLTIAEINNGSFTVWIIPHTFRSTNLKAAKPGELVNLEFDLLAKYVERLLPRALTLASQTPDPAIDDESSKKTKIEG